MKKPVFRGETTAVNVKTPLGEITVLDNHRPLITAVVKSQVVITRPNGEKVTIDVKSGFLEIRPKGEIALIAN